MKLTILSPSLCEPLAALRGVLTREQLGLVTQVHDALGTYARRVSVADDIERIVADVAPAPLGSLRNALTCELVLELHTILVAYALGAFAQALSTDHARLFIN